MPLFSSGVCVAKRGQLLCVCRDAPRQVVIHPIWSVLLKTARTHQKIYAILGVLFPAFRYNSCACLS